MWSKGCVLCVEQGVCGVKSVCGARSVWSKGCYYVNIICDFRNELNYWAVISSCPFSHFTSFL